MLRPTLHAVLFMFLGFEASAQIGAEQLTNGTFTGNLSGWTLGGGFSVNPGLDTVTDTTGRGVSDCFGCNPGGQSGSAPFPANTIAQSVPLLAGSVYEFRCDVSSSRVNAASLNIDAGTIFAEIDGVEIDRISFGSIAVGETKRAQLGGRFLPQTSGAKVVKISMQRSVLASATTPHVTLDNVSLRIVKMLSIFEHGNRKLGSAVTFDVVASPNFPFAVFLAAGEDVAGIAISGFSNLLHLDLATLTFLFSGTTGSNGLASVPLTLPNNSILLTSPLFFQAAQVPPNTILHALSLHFGTVATR